MNYSLLNLSPQDILEDPIRAEIFSIERLEQYAVYLAEHLKTGGSPKERKPLLKRLQHNSEALIKVYHSLSESVHLKEEMSPTAEWLVDNFHIIENQIREIQNDLPESYYKELPKLVLGDLSGFPRIYAFVLALVAHTDSRLEVETLRRVVEAFQTKSYLNIGELWAVAITLRLALVENARRLALRAVWDLNQKKIANTIADEILEGHKDSPNFKKNLAKIVGLCGQSIDKEYAFVSQLAKRLRDQEGDVWPVQDCLETTLRKMNITVEQVVDLDHRQQAANLMTISNIITSMRLLSNINWQKFTESVCLLDRILEEDPAGAYRAMTFSTRDEYRRAIERISKNTKVSETAVAAQCLALAQSEAQKTATEKRRSHVGFFLREAGFFELGKIFKYRPRLKERCLRAVHTFPNFLYLGSLVCLIVLMCAPPVYYSYLQGASLPMLALLIPIIFIPCSDLAVSLLNFALTNLIKPLSLPKMDLTAGVPAEARTMVIIPCLLFNSATVAELLEKLEVHYLGNEDENMYFSLVTDYVDADKEVLPEDKVLLREALEGIKVLNKKYAQEKEIFFIFHRKRLWNPGENRWMGWERKRGKIHEFNRALRGDSSTSFEVITAPLELRKTIKYVITLDGDTQLNRDCAKKLIGTALHPLNRPEFDEQLGRVVEGYGIFQPRISICLESSSRSMFAEIFSGHTGIDPYTTAVSDLYQDIFLEGSYTGKGLYDVDVFEKALKDRVPENTILSHDLFEGSYARTALVPDIELLDDYPKTYQSFFLRQHRWTRGDWQIAPWILSHVPSATGEKRETDLNIIARWKIYDNLRRSMVAPGTFLLFVMGWLFLPGSPLFWTLLALATIVVPCMLHVANSILVSPRGIPWTSNFWTAWGRARLNLLQALLSLLFLAHQAYVQVDAIVRVWYRTLISKTNRLEWVPAARQETHGEGKKSFWQSPGPVYIMLTVVLAGLLIAGRWPTLFLALPFLFLWGTYSPVARFVSCRRKRKTIELQEHDKSLLQDISRRIWCFFETFVGPEDNWLPPDNYQEDPAPLIAHRTSPTNIGLYALSIVAAKDFGYLGIGACVERVELLFETLNKMERFEGHFFNWYDTQNLAPLYPKYISLVDSGNLAGYLLVVKESLAELASSPIVDDKFLSGMLVTLRIIESEAKKLPRQQQVTSAMSSCQLTKEIHECIKILSSPAPQRLSDWFVLLRYLRQNMEEVNDSIKVLEFEHGPRYYEMLRAWFGKAFVQLERRQEDLILMAPWLEATSDLGPHEEAAKDILDRQFTLSAILEAYQNTPVSVQDGLSHVRGLLDKIETLCRQSNDFFESMNFGFLLDEEQEVFSIGYNVNEGRHDNSFYDLLASEARLASFIAIAKADIPQKHWFLLGRKLIPVDGHRALISWSGSMFEYLMPSLVMRHYENTLLDETLNAVVKRQVSYGNKLKVPWGVSEAGYNARDVNFNYQYGPFGIPGMGLKRGLGQDLVITPYSSFLAALINSAAAMENIKELIKMDLLRNYGFYESVDYTPERLLEKQKFAVVKSFMTHHQGMSLVAIDNVLNQSIMQNRFHAELRVRATQLLLQERVPQKVVLTLPKVAEIEWKGIGQRLARSFVRHYHDPNLRSPRVQMLSNGTYSLMLSTAGSGYSKCEDLAVSRWREDATCDNWGHFVYVRDLTKKLVWSATYQPMVKKPDSYKATFTEDKIEFLREDQDIETHTQVIVAPEDNVELRQITFTNHSLEERILEVTSYSEPVLAPLADDLAQPAFSNLFIQTEFIASKNSLVAKRRPRLAQKSEIWGLHGVMSEEDLTSEIQYETDRTRFIGRGRNLTCPKVLEEGESLSNTLGSTLDPVLSLRVKIVIPPGATRRLVFTTGLARSHEEVLQLADRYHEINSFERECRLAWTKAQMGLRHLGLDSEAAYLFQRLAERIIYVSSTLRPPSSQLAQNIRDQSSLWTYGISGDVPIVVLVVSSAKDMALVRKLLRGHEYLRLKGLVYDFVILNDSRTTYFQEMQEEIQQQIRHSGALGWANKVGGIYTLRLDMMASEDRMLLQSMARVVLSSQKESLQEQITRKTAHESYAAALTPTMEKITYRGTDLNIPRLDYFNSLGGFSKDGREYITVLKENQWTPAPWINVIANARDFGFQVSETGSGFTWSMNSRLNRLTVWSNDPVCDPPAEAIYLRDEETGEVWTPTPLPIRDSSVYVVRHGQGYTTFEHVSHGILHTLTLFVPKEDSIKISNLHLKNISGRSRRISVTGYVEWVLGDQRSKAAPYINTEVDEETQAIFAFNRFNLEFADRVAFFDISAKKRSFTCDRKEFLGRNGTYADPAALKRQGLSQKKGIGHDPCAALQTVLELKNHQEQVITVTLGQAENVDIARTLVTRYRDQLNVTAAFKEVQDSWDQILNTIQVKTPEPTLDVMLNRWLLYQAVVCRMWARSAFYQSGGAYGFRDQLQDCMAFVYSTPQMAREHILRAARRQFPEGDVQHWWHPPSGRGVRTHFSDDLLWLPLVVSHYIKVTGDQNILKEVIPFLDAPLLKPEQEDSYLLPQVSQEQATLFDHCLRTLDRSLSLGAHGLPLMGTGDWNDGMNRVGHEGKGESVWMGWFLYKVLTEFLPYCEGQPEKVRRYKEHMQTLKNNIESNAWDGSWYRRAYFDDGTPLGSGLNEECRMDSLAQSWSVLSRAGDPDRQMQAMQMVSENLILRDQRLVLLLTPPFDKMTHDPGYIKGYVPGVRENGGQYTHAAIWVMMAYAELGNTEQVLELFNMLNPVNHSKDRVGLHKYKIEPYVVAADVYAVEPHNGRGGWSWYTGSASWFYRAGLESLLGFHVEGDTLRLSPCVPKTWKKFEITYKYKTTTYHLIFEKSGKHPAEKESRLQLQDDGQTHRIQIQI